MEKSQKILQKHLNSRLSALQKRQDEALSSVKKTVKKREKFLKKERTTVQKRDDSKSNKVLYRPYKTPKFDISHSKLVELDNYLEDQEFSLKNQMRIKKRFEARAEFDERIVVQSEHLYINPTLFDYSDLLTTQL